MAKTALMYNIDSTGYRSLLAHVAHYGQGVFMGEGEGPSGGSMALSADGSADRLELGLIRPADMSMVGVVGI